ncbi:response regulator FixJ [Sphingomonas sp. G-3-2-10]|uniref:response regulator FixJ n=1 Tax=Sphingomonas sp. G-3-2-10 TaxID=2728838 RepID=UPI00146BCE77|nr:response regulator FixJ [Sphingomonas sp. G-3-2-10]NML07473.1 response regulator transcription factor [Sphingomonas sp. G-3-2-10]
MTGQRTIHIVDDEEAIRKSAGFMLRTSGFEVETYVDGVAFLDAVKGAAPGCILLDVRMPGMDGLEVQAELNARGVPMPVIVLTGHGDISTAVVAMKGGAVDFIEKPFEKTVLLDAIERAFERLDQKVEAATSEQDAKTRLSVLTQREVDVLRGLVRGHPNKTIAYDLGISPRTVEVHRANLMAKLGVRSLSEALRIAFGAGLEGDG